LLTATGEYNARPETMGNCTTKPKTKDDDDAPPPAELQTPVVAEEERKDEKVAAPEETQEPPVEPSQAVAVAAPKAEVR
jgi:hypothetical protein